MMKFREFDVKQVLVLEGVAGFEKGTTEYIPIDSKESLRRKLAIVMQEYKVIDVQFSVDAGKFYALVLVGEKNGK
jgi:hypothetical protein